jgi:hypothetical protein
MSADWYEPLPATVTLELPARVPEQVASLGPYRANMIEPVGATPPLNVAVSWTWPPAGTEADAVVVSVGVTRPPVTTTDSLGSRQPVGPSPRLLASPSYRARHL